MAQYSWSIPIIVHLRRTPIPKPKEFGSVCSPVFTVKLRIGAQAMDYLLEKQELLGSVFAEKHTRNFSDGYMLL
jgi:hypothetical protein